MTKSQIIAALKEEFGVDVSNRIRKATAELLLAELREPNIEHELQEHPETEVHTTHTSGQIAHFACPICNNVTTIKVV